jgi:hypothetical protein
MDDPISVQAGPVRIQRPTHTIRPRWRLVSIGGLLTVAFAWRYWF